MTYPLSATRLQAYHRCPQAYYYQYERRVPTASFFGSQALGRALHKALAQIYGEWHYREPRPQWQWLRDCWQQNLEGLSERQVADGESMLRQYYDAFMVPQATVHRPLGIETQVKGQLQVENLEFRLSGRYDRLDWLDDGLELIDYKTTREIARRAPAEMDLQLGLYYLALEQQYKSSLKRLSFIYLRTAKKVSFDVTPSHRQQVEETIADLAIRLRRDEEWPACPGDYCDRCGYARYCHEVSDEPEPLPPVDRQKTQLQLVLGF